MRQESFKSFAHTKRKLLNGKEDTETPEGRKNWQFSTDMQQQQQQQQQQGLFELQNC